MKSESSLQAMFDMQAQLQEAMTGKGYPKDDIELFKYSTLGLLSELGEVLAADKRWKNIRKGYYNRDEKLHELVDCMAFLVNMVITSDFNASEFEQAFKEKNKENFRRLDEGK